VQLGQWEESSEPAALPLSPAGNVRPAKACIIRQTWRRKNWSEQPDWVDNPADYQSDLTLITSVT
jgi:hypothetical protein